MGPLVTYLGEKTDALRKKILDAYYVRDLQGGLKACEELRGTDAWTEADESNSLFYLPKISDFCRFFVFDRMFTDLLPPHYRETNPSVVSHEDGLFYSIRAVNYTLDMGEALGRGFFIRDKEIRSINTLIRPQRGHSSLLNRIESVSAPFSGSSPKGFEDLRLFFKNGRLHALATWAGQMCELLFSSNYYGIEAFKVLDLCSGRVEKNWAPVLNTSLAVYGYFGGCFSLVDTSKLKLSRGGPIPPALRGAKGSSQLIPYGKEHLAIVHFTSHLPNCSVRTYYHRFVLFSESLDRVLTYSRPFRFSPSPDREDLKTVEFCAGLAQKEDGYIITFGWDDCEAWKVVVGREDVEKVLDQ